MFTDACKKITGNGLAAGYQLFYPKIYGYILQCSYRRNGYSHLAAASDVFMASNFMLSFPTWCLALNLFYFFLLGIKQYRAVQSIVSLRDGI